MFKIKSRPKWFIRSLVVIGAMVICGILGTSYLFHRDSAHRRFAKEINPKVTQLTGIDWGGILIGLAHKLDFVGIYKGFCSPIEPSRQFDLGISDSVFFQLQREPKTWIEGTLKHQNEEYKIKIKLHGSSDLHYVDGKFSFRIKFKNDSPKFHQKQVINFIKGEEADPTIAVANGLAKSFGLIASAGKMVRLKVNGKTFGSYYMVEHVSEDYAKSIIGCNTLAKVSQVGDWSRKEIMQGMNHASFLDLFQGHLNYKKGGAAAESIDAYRRLCAAVLDNDTAGVLAFFDPIYMGNYLAVLSIFNDIHHVTGDNFKMFYDPDKGVFYPLYRQEQGCQSIHNTVLSENDPMFINFNNYNRLVFEKSQLNSVNMPNHKILKSLLCHPTVRQIRDQVLMEIINSSDSLINNFKLIYSENRAFYWGTDLSRKSQDLKEKKQVKTFFDMLRLGKDYLSYGHLYGTLTQESGVLDLAVDSYVPIRLKYPTNERMDTLVLGIVLDVDLNTHHSFAQLKISSDNGGFNQLLAINTITGDTIERDKIYFNKAKSRAVVTD